MSAPPAYARLQTIGEVAKERDCSWRKMWRLLRKLHEGDSRRGEKRKWLFRGRETSRLGGRGDGWLVNRGVLKLVHPELFEARSAYVIHELTERVDRLERNDAALKVRVGSLAAEVRKVTRARSMVMDGQERSPEAHEPP